jgi:hypothetical protein
MSRLITEPTTISSRPIRRRSNSRTSPPMIAAAVIALRNPTATQNSRSVRHHPVIRSVAMTAVAQPLTMLTTAAATAVRGSASPACFGMAVGRGRGM